MIERGGAWAPPDWPMWGRKRTGRFSHIERQNSHPSTSISSAHRGLLQTREQASHQNDADRSEKRSVGRCDERGDIAQCHAAVGALSTLRIHLEELFAIALHDQVLGRHSKRIDQDARGDPTGSGCLLPIRPHRCDLPRAGWRRGPARLAPWQPLPYPR